MSLHVLFLLWQDGTIGYRSLVLIRGHQARLSLTLLWFIGVFALPPAQIVYFHMSVSFQYTTWCTRICNFVFAVSLTPLCFTLPSHMHACLPTRAQEGQHHWRRREWAQAPCRLSPVLHSDSSLLPVDSPPIVSCAQQAQRDRRWHEAEQKAVQRWAEEDNITSPSLPGPLSPEHSAPTLLEEPPCRRHATRQANVHSLAFSLFPSRTFSWQVNASHPYSASARQCRTSAPVCCVSISVFVTSRPVQPVHSIAPHVESTQTTQSQLIT